ncbi:PACE efflux transporter [Ruegeria sp. Ofav3-42]|nr:PACE efflux transporter [Ruegeria sp. Ofav3-42]
MTDCALLHFRAAAENDPSLWVATNASNCSNDARIAEPCHLSTYHMVSTFIDLSTQVQPLQRHEFRRTHMSFGGRILHAVLFEVFALLSIALLLPMISHVDVHKSLILGVFFSLAAMLWNVVFNTGFDWYLKNIRRNMRKSAAVRGVHALLFEGSFVALTLPVLAWALGLTLWGAMKLEAALIVFILVYTFCFNIVFDWCRVKLTNPTVS